MSGINYVCLTNICKEQETRLNLHEHDGDDDDDDDEDEQIYTICYSAG